MEFSACRSRALSFRLIFKIVIGVSSTHIEAFISQEINTPAPGPWENFIFYIVLVLLSSVFLKFPSSWLGYLIFILINGHIASKISSLKHLRRVFLLESEDRYLLTKDCSNIVVKKQVVNLYWVYVFAEYAFTFIIPPGIIFCTYLLWRRSIRSLDPLLCTWLVANFAISFFSQWKQSKGLLQVKDACCNETCRLPDLSSFGNEFCFIFTALYTYFKYFLSTFHLVHHRSLQRHRDALPEILAGQPTDMKE